MKVVIGLSGGVDSSVAAYLLKEQGHEVIGLFMVNWHDRTGTLTSSCSWEDDWDLAQMVAKKLEIPVQKVDLSDYYRKRVVDYMFDEYAKGRTPNPDVLCNREIKFDIFLDKCLELGADMVATGHYCRKETTTINGETVHRLIEGSDPNKDQSYFLCQLSQQQLSKALFPIGDIIKPRVREIATEIGLPTATRKDSQGICFVGKVDLPQFLQQKLQTKKGNVIEVTTEGVNAYLANKGESLEELSTPINFRKINGEWVGEHSGAHFYTIGQRKGLNIGGKALPLFIVGTNVEKNVIYVGQGNDFIGLFRKGLFVAKEEIHWVRPDLQLKVDEVVDFDVRIRYRQPLQKATLHMKENGLYIIFEEPQRAVSAGQFAAWYRDGEVIGSGVIEA